MQGGPGAPVTENQRDLGQPVSPSVQESEMLSVPGSNVLRSPHQAAVSDGKAGSAGLALTSPQQLIVFLSLITLGITMESYYVWWRSVQTALRNAKKVNQFRIFSPLNSNYSKT